VRLQKSNCQRNESSSFANKKGSRLRFLSESGAGEESRTLDLNLGKVALYQLSYSRFETWSIVASRPPFGDTAPQ
jgi:hypothetical protein